VAIIYFDDRIRIIDILTPYWPSLIVGALHERPYHAMKLSSGIGGVSGTGCCPALHRIALQRIASRAPRLEQENAREAAADGVWRRDRATVQTVASRRRRNHHAAHPRVDRGVGVAVRLRKEHSARIGLKSDRRAMRMRKRGGYEVDYGEKCHWETVSGAWLIVFMRLRQNNSRRLKYLRQKDGGAVRIVCWVPGRL
jgi:hypothetical protein